MVFGKDEVKNEEEYATKLKEMIANQLMLDSNYRFTLDAQKVLMEKVGNLELPVEFLKKWLKKTTRKSTTRTLTQNTKECFLPQNGNW